MEQTEKIKNGKEKAGKAVPKVEAKPKEPKQGPTITVKPKNDKAPDKKEKKGEVDLDEFGFRKTSMSHEAFQLFKTGKYTMKQVKEKMKASGFFEAIKRAKKLGHKVTKDAEGHIKAVPK